MTNYCKYDRMSFCDCEKKEWREQKKCEFADRKSSAGDYCMYYHPKTGRCDNREANNGAMKDG